MTGSTGGSELRRIGLLVSHDFRHVTACLANDDRQFGSLDNPAVTARAMNMKIGDYKVVSASPCDINWDSMHGDEKKRFCHQCNLFVYNLVAMDENEKIDFIRMAQENKNQRTCARIYTRKDNTVIAEDCPLGIRLKRVYRTCKITCTLMIVAILGNMGINELRRQLDKSLAEVQKLQLGNVYLAPSRNDARNNL